MKSIRNILPAALLAASLLPIGQPVRADALGDCLLESLKNAADTTTVADLRARCQQASTAAPVASTAAAPDVAEPPPSAIEQRITEEYSLAERDYLLTAYRPTFLLPVAYNSKPNQQVFTDIDPSAAELDKNEVEFQVSFKFPLIRQLWGNNDVLATYTAKSWWQFYNDDDNVSSAFRETNYEPEILFRHYGGPELLGGKVAGFDIGFNHQSNGRGEALSRSWNRVLAQTFLDYGDLGVAIRGWYRIPEDEEDDDNPHMHRYYGYGDIRAIWAPNDNTFTAMIRPGTEEVGYELTWSYPITDVLRVYALYYNGFGESLIDYDQRVERVGIGISISDYLMR
jgi:phospholipase A1